MTWLRRQGNNLSGMGVRDLVLRSAANLMTNQFCLRTFWLKKGWDLLAHITKKSSYIKSSNNTVNKQSRSTHYMASPTLNRHTHTESFTSHSDLRR